MDVLPLALRAANGNAPAGARLNGRDPYEAITGKSGSPHEFLTFEWERQQALRSGRWKLIREGGQPWQLYDLDTDIGETSDLAPAHPELAAALGVKFEAWRNAAR
jgi:arylsulfatase